jgi:lipopolysaccharide/colanic/teichoic acid biosynthesis glycosyltransferase
MQMLPHTEISATRLPCWAAIAKRTTDIAGAAIGLAVFSPLLAGIALAVRLGSPGPIFYRGTRSGRYGKPFRILKFRSMVVNAEQIGSPTTGKNDPRITGVGHVLRRYKLDELPQLINVLVGDMSFVGPRPEVVEYTNRYTAEECAIFSVRPGITDLACLEFHDLQEVVGSTDPEQVYRTDVLPCKTALRLKYVRDQSLLGDLRILMRTVWLVLTKSLGN